jgi:hypothetical protein
MRPLFLIADSFVKSNRVRQQRIHYFPKTALNEEINYSKLAIKFSKNLTKDMVFSSLRDIIRFEIPQDSNNCQNILIGYQNIEKLAISFQEAMNLKYRFLLVF